MMSRSAEITVRVDLDDDDVPTRMEWQATEAREDGPVPCQSMMLSLWDSNHRSTVAIDLWTQEMTVDEMDLHFYQVIHKLADTYLRATKNSEMARQIHAFGNDFGESLGLVHRDDVERPANEAAVMDLTSDGDVLHRDKM